ncbi:KAP family P-loop NTPase fold protein [Photobacterium damselae]|uniref:KAP family P-loop NTPase fold protein n=1 Tax=Photobacterium damselae TaxID=38293 RepID=UPI0040677BAE
MTSTQLKDKPVKYANWLTEANFDNCKLNRKAYGEFLIDYITSENDGFVLNLNGQWGAGKTEFLKRTYTELITRNHPTIYIDAWESDFCDTPLTVVTSELLNQLERFDSSIVNKSDKLKRLFGKFLKGTVIAGAGMATKYALNEASVGVEAAKTLFEEDPKSFMNQLKSDYSDKVQAIKDIRESLGDLATELNNKFDYRLPIVVLVDELDRCRPNYAIEMLEVIKHFFTTKHFVFVVATDTNQLTKSIKAVYGDEFDSNQYLKRFFSRKAQLPEPNIEHYLDAIGVEDKLREKGLSTLTPYPRDVYYFNNTTKWLSFIAKGYNLDIRSLDQLIAKLGACIKTFAINYSKQSHLLNIPVLITALIEHDNNCDSFYRRDDFTHVPTDLKSTYEINPSYSHGSTKLQELINISFEILTRAIKGGEYNQPHVCSSFTYDDFVRWRDLSRSKPVMLEFLNSASNKSSEEADSKLRWSDYKKVIELAGNLE